MRHPTATLLALLLMTLPFARADGAERERILFDDGWRFRLGDPVGTPTAEFAYPEIRDLAKANKDDFDQEKKLAGSRKDPVANHLGESAAVVKTNFDDSKWRELNLPHDWVVELPFEMSANLDHGCKPIKPGTNDIGWYRKSFELPAADRGKVLSVEFDGVYRNSVVWLNGHCLGRNLSGYSSFEYDISSAANYGGKNELVVRVDASRTEGWFYEGAGVYRHVWLKKLPTRHLNRNDTFVWVTPSDDGVGGKVHCRFTATGLPPNPTDKDLADLGHLVDFHLADAAGHEVGNLSGENFKIDGSLFYEDFTLVVDYPHWWSTETPYLYRLSITLSGDRLQIPVGIRWAKFDADKGFFLNGKHVFIAGTCNHQDAAGVGSAVPDALQEWRLLQLKKFGCNAIRTSHNPPTPELLDACDRVGMLVMDEQRQSGDTPELLDETRRMILRDRNHPSVILWSIGNEENNIQGDDAVGLRVAKAMKPAIVALDTTRPVTSAMNGGWGHGFSPVLDVQGFNYPLNTSTSQYHRDHPKQPLIGSEEASTVSTRGVYENDRTKGYVSAYDVNAPPWACTAEKWHGRYVNEPFLAGCFVWTGFDYRGEPTPYAWPCINSHFGLLDTCGFFKDEAYYYQSIWCDHPMLHLFPHWNWSGKEGQPVEVWCYAKGCDEVELLLNGKSLGRQKYPDGMHVSWTVSYQPGKLMAVGYKDGKKILDDAAVTTGEPTTLVLQSDRSRLTADGRDVAVLKVSAVDAKGIPVPTASNFVHIAVTGGELIGVGNGDPSCHEPDKATSRSLFNGLCCGIVQAPRVAGTVKITVTGDGLTPATMTLAADPVATNPGT